MSCPLERSRHDPVFLSHPSPTLLLSRDFTIKAVNRAYLASSGRTEHELVSVNVFEAFPENPATPAATKEFTDSFEWVVRSRQPHHVIPLRYDVEEPARSGRFVEKRWALVNTPIQVEDEVVGVMVRVEDVTLAGEQLVTALRAHRDALVAAGTGTSADHVRAEAADSFLAVMESYTNLANEVTNLRRALRSRPTIEQAKGIIMAGRGCSPDEAFEMLKHLSMDSNVRLADVAAAIVYQLRSP